MRQGLTLTYLHADALGSAALGTGLTGTVVSSLRYTPYGLPRGETGRLPTPYRYTGQREMGVGFYDYQARLYDPAVGRFAQADTLVPEAGKSQSLNRYTYGYNNPVKYQDPSGHFAWIPLGLVGGIIGGAIYGYGFQVVHNLDQGMNFGQALATNIDPGAIAMYAGAGATIGTGIGIVAAGVTAIASVAAPATVTTVGTSGASAGTIMCADGDCTNEVNIVGQLTQRARVIYNDSLPAGAGFTDQLGNMTISSQGTALDKQLALHHEQVHAFFTPRGPLQSIRADFSMLAYQNSHLLRYVEEAIAESRAQILTGGSLQTGLTFPIVNGYVSPTRVVFEAGVIGTTTYVTGKLIGKVLAQ